MRVLQALHEILEDIPILFTFRTKAEGGEKEIAAASYERLNCQVAASGLADLIDVEIFTGDDTVRSILAAAHRANVPVIASNHHFHETPDQETILEILTKMDQMGADILKIAVMPQSRKDVLTLLSATEEMDRRTTKPLITMSMGPVGMISRLCGEVFGSALTFGAVGKVSAPGQIGSKGSGPRAESDPPKYGKQTELIYQMNRGRKGMHGFRCLAFLFAYSLPVIAIAAAPFRK